MKAQMKGLKENFSYKGIIYTFKELLVLPECELSYSQLLYRLGKGLSVAAAFSGDSMQKRKADTKRGKNKRTLQKVLMAGKPVLLESQKRRIKRREIDRIKKIMAVPVNPKKCRYHQTEVTKKQELKTIIKGTK